MNETPQTPQPPIPPNGHHDPLSQATHLTEETGRQLLNLFEKSYPVRRLRSSHLVSAVIGSMGLALFLVGVEQAAADLPIVSNAYGSIGVGFLLLLATGLLLRKLG